jgi:glycosyltransferase involved in cell wall biosynthesis
MRVVFFAQQMPDPCGAFFHDIVLARALRAKGHTVTFVTMKSMPRRGEYRGIPFVNYMVAGNELEKADIWNSPHYPFLSTVRKLNEKFEKPLVIVMHYGEDRKNIETCTRTGQWAEFLWVVSKHIREKITKMASSIVDTYVVRPTFIESETRFRLAPERSEGECITLINANLLKGLGVFVDLAKRFPERKFLGVKPYYNIVQVPTDIPNIEWIDFQDDIRVVLKRTRVLIVPSYYESWGRVAFEAMLNGIPVLYARPHDESTFTTGSTEGMRDWIQDNGIQCDRRSLEDWVTGIISLDAPDVYNDYSDRAYKCTNDMNIFTEIPTIEQKFYNYAVRYAPASKSKTMDTSSSAPGGVPRLVMPGMMSMPGRRRPAPSAAPAAAPIATPTAAPSTVPRMGFVAGRFGVRR